MEQQKAGSRFRRTQPLNSRSLERRQYRQEMHAVRKELGIRFHDHGELVHLSSDRPCRHDRRRGPIGPQNDAWLIRLASDAEVIVACWGTKGGFRERDKAVMKLLRMNSLQHKLYCLDLSSKGHPKHPLYLKASSKPIPFFGAEACTLIPDLSLGYSTSESSIGLRRIRG